MNDGKDVTRLKSQLDAALEERDALREELDQIRRKQPLVEVLDSIIEAIVIYDADGRLVVCNENFRNLYGYTEAETRPGVHFSDLGRIDIERGNVAVGDEFGSGEAYLARKAEYRRKLEGSFIVQLKDGRWIKTVDRPISGGGFVSIQIDITEVKTLEQDMRYMAQHDALTGLPNRRLFMEKGAVLLDAAKREKTLLAVLFLDIDGYKQVNDSLGHQMGDHILKLIGDRLKDRIRSSDVVARLGGDEFVVLLGRTSRQATRHVADVIIGEIGNPFSVEGNEVVLGTSIGIAYFPDDGIDLVELLKRSDTALYRAKDAGKGRWCEYAN